MREIKFRMWNGSQMRQVHSMFSKAHERIVNPPSDDPEYNFNHQEPLMQYTGLKDKNGKEIYEGDIVLDWKTSRRVKWSNQNASFYLSHLDGKRAFYKEFIECLQSQSSGPVHCNTIEVIGNIYENQELLK